MRVRVQLDKLVVWLSDVQAVERLAASKICSVVECDVMMVFACSHEVLPHTHTRSPIELSGVLSTCSKIGKRRGVAGIEPTTSPTQTENHTTRPNPH